MTVLQPDPSKSERHLLAAIHYWMRHNGWGRIEEGWSNLDVVDREGDIVAVRPWVEGGGVLGVEIYKARAEQGGGGDWWEPIQLVAWSVTQAVDLLVAYHVLPPFWSSAFALAEDKCDEEIQVLEARVNELEAMLAHVNGDASKRAFDSAMELLR